MSKKIIILDNQVCLYIVFTNSTLFFKRKLNQKVAFHFTSFFSSLNLQPTYGGIRQELGRLQFPPGESPRVSKMYIYAGSSLAECSTPSLPSPRYPTVHHEEVLVLRQNSQTIGLRVRLSTFPDIRDGKSVAFQTRDVFFGDSAQDVVCAIGAPARTFYKSEDKMKIHSPNAFRKSASHKSDYCK